jgi:hypothetical protein
MKPVKYIGMDVHQATISVAVLDERGKLIMECIVETSTGGLAHLYVLCEGVDDEVGCRESTVPVCT